MTTAADEHGPTDSELEAAVRELSTGIRGDQQAALDRLASAAQAGDRSALRVLLALAERGPDEGGVRVLGTLGMVQHPDVLIFLVRRQRVETSRRRLKTIRRAVHRLTACGAVLERAREIAGDDLPELFTDPRPKPAGEERGVVNPTRPESEGSVVSRAIPPAESHAPS
jgi:hypothetical protein